MNFFNLIIESLSGFFFFFINSIFIPIYFFSSIFNSFLNLEDNYHSSLLLSLYVNLLEYNGYFNFITSLVLYFTSTALKANLYLTDIFLNFISYNWLKELVNFLFYYMHYMLHMVFNETVSASLVVSFKFLVLIALLVFVRGGIPRYRFDYLTKLGWTKFLSLILISFIFELCLLWTI